MKTLIKLLLIVAALSFQACAQTTDIIGVWEVKTDHYEATYEIVAYKEQFFGKVISYKDDSYSYSGNDQKKDYFLTDVTYTDGQYTGGKMYLPDGSFYHVIFNLKDPNTLEALMTVDGEPYRELWKRKTSN